jgi:hypothetical protein
LHDETIMSRCHRFVSIVALMISACAAHPQRTTARAVPPIAKIPIFVTPNAIDPSSCIDAIDPREAKKVFDALFPSYLTSTTECARPEHEPDSWTEVDRVQAEDYLNGQFVPSIVRRTVTPSDLPSDDQPADDRLSYVVQVESCQQNMFGHLVDATFLRAELDRPRAKPFSRSEEHPLAPEMPKPLPRCTAAAKR